ncbi:reverse transcriptase [Daphnia sinensis]|uniref:Reverse transcriptase n=1 Tax=Daphnia sinensis TaxID=1820382 RepID=A0AAD5PM45_9CRUS|nr:reverse transcriptase [Daphnia sinensis]
MDMTPILPLRERRQTVCHNMLTILHGHSEPSSYQEAITSTEADLWQKAIREEYDSLIENGTWVLAKLPHGRAVIKGKWVFKLKPSYLNLIPARYKARYVAKGYSQKPEIDYKEKFSPVVKHDCSIVRELETGLIVSGMYVFSDNDG